MNKSKLVIGLTGEKGSGKETFYQTLKKLTKKKIVQLRFGDILAETLRLWDIPTTRRNLQQLAIVMNKGFGLGTLTHAMEKRIEKEEADIIIIDGVRWLDDAKMIRKQPNNKLIYITADVKIRYLRLKEKSDKVKEMGISFAQFMREEKIKTEIDIPKIGKKADIKIVNNETLDKLKSEIKNLLAHFSS